MSGKTSVLLRKSVVVFGFFFLVWVFCEKKAEESL